MKTSALVRKPLQSPLAGTVRTRTPHGLEKLRISAPPLESFGILLPVDFSRASVWALRHTARLALRDGNSILLLHVVDPGSFMNGLQDSLLAKSEDQLLHDAETGLSHLAGSELAGTGAVSFLVKAGRAGPEIIRTAREARSDLIVLIVDHRSLVERARHFLFGSTAAWVERHAPCAVLAISPPKGTLGEPIQTSAHESMEDVWP